jgi:hypothetical protein
MTAPTMNARSWAMLLALALLWGGSFFFVGVAVREWPPVAIVLARVGLAAVALWAVVLAMGLPVRRDGVALRAHLGMGVLNNAIPLPADRLGARDAALGRGLHPQRDHAPLGRRRRACRRGRARELEPCGRRRGGVLRRRLDGGGGPAGLAAAGGAGDARGDLQLRAGWSLGGGASGRWRSRRW